MTDEKTNFECFQIQKDDRGVVTVTVDLPDRPLNVFNERVLRELDGVLSQLENDASARLVVFRSGKESGFFAGADVTEVEGMKTVDEVKEVVAAGQSLFNRVEALRMPTVAVIHGPCLGGGLEFALACTARIARDDGSTRIGLPEVTLGFIPAWGGTQRLPRLVGLTTALGMILEAKKLPAARAKKIGLVDAAAEPSQFDAQTGTLIDVLLANQKTVIARRPKLPLKDKLLNYTGIGRWLVFKEVRKKIAKNATNYPALPHAVRAVEIGLSSTMQAGLEYEQNAFAELVFSPTCRSLLSLFYGREKARNPKTWSSLEKSKRLADVQNIGVVGGGTMGAGIAQLACYQGYNVVLKEINDEQLAAGKERIDKLFDDLVRKGRMRQSEAEERLAKMTCTLEWSDFADCDVIVEAVIENEELKQTIFRDLEANVKESALLVSNTSSIPIANIGEVVKEPDRVAGLHFFNPVHRMDLVEIVKTDTTTEKTIDALVRLVKKLGKTSIVVADSPGFLVNRILFPYLSEGVRLFCEGASASQIDKEMKKFGMPMGPMELLDVVGVDVAAHVAQTMEVFQTEPNPTAKVLSAMCEQDRKGQKTGIGFYQWEGRKKVGSVPFDATGLIDIPAAVSEFSAADNGEAITRRLILSLLNESAKCLGEQIVTEPWMVDLSMVIGTGFAPFRGGPLRTIDQMGIRNVIADLERLQKECGNRFECCSLLREYFGANRNFFESAKEEDRQKSIA